jgi:hypothetical protein
MEAPCAHHDVCRTRAERLVGGSADAYLKRAAARAERGGLAWGRKGGAAVRCALVPGFDGHALVDALFGRKRNGRDDCKADGVHGWVCECAGIGE